MFKYSSLADKLNLYILKIFKAVCLLHKNYTFEIFQKVFGLI